jgi:transposase
VREFVDLSKAELLQVIERLTEELAVERAARLRAEQRVVELTGELALLTAQVSELTNTVAELTARLTMNSSNSSMPPSKDPPASPPRSLRSKTGRKAGGQPGRRGSTLRMTDTPNEVHHHRPAHCGDCGQKFTNTEPPTSTDRRQVFDLPANITLEVVEHRIHSLACRSCGTTTKAGIPAVTRSGVQYGPGIASLTVYLVNQPHVSIARTAQITGDVFSAAISPGTITKWINQAGQVITDEFKSVAADLLAAGEVAHADETGFKVAGVNHWAHSLSNPKATWIQVHPRRGREAMDDIGVLPRLSGCRVRQRLVPSRSCVWRSRP